MASESPGHENHIARWDELGAAPGGDPGFRAGDSYARSTFVNGLRQLADFLESRPEIPVPDHGTAVTVYAAGSTAEKFDQVDYAGRLLGTPVTDETARGGHLYTEREFGPVSYEFVATGVAAAFTVGQDVRLTADQSAEVESEGLALAGTVTGLLPELDGTYSYTVHFPGDHGPQPGLAEDQLEETVSPAVRLRDGSVLSIKEAEELLIDAVARAHVDPGSRVPGQAGQILEGLEQACGVELCRLYDQVKPKIDQRELELAVDHAVKKPPSPAALAAKDSPGPLLTSLANVELDLPRHQPAAPPAPRRDGPRR